MYADLTVITGPMFAGKTTALIRAIELVAGSDPILIVKPRMDDRYADDAIVSHDGQSWAACSVASLAEFVDAVARASGASGRAVHVFVDEIQFFHAPHFDAPLHPAVQGLLAEGHTVTCAGLDLDWRGLPFDVTARLLAMADHVTKLKARCAVTGLPASKSFKKAGGEAVVELGSGDLYEPRANAHFHVGLPDAAAEALSA